MQCGNQEAGSPILYIQQPCRKDCTERKSKADKPYIDRNDERIIKIPAAKISQRIAPIQAGIHMHELQCKKKQKKASPEAGAFDASFHQTQNAHHDSSLSMYETGCITGTLL